MVKGISRQVIVVHSPDKRLFEQAIFILKDDAIGQTGVTDDILLKEAKHLINNAHRNKNCRFFLYGPVWAAGGALITGCIWLVSALF